MFDHALGHHGTDAHAGTARPQHHNALLGEAVRGLALHLQGSIHSCKGCCSRALQCSIVQLLVGSKPATHEPAPAPANPPAPP